EQQPTARRCRVDRLIKDDEIDAQGLQFLGECDQVVGASGEPVQLHANDDMLRRAGAARRPHSAVRSRRWPPTRFTATRKSALAAPAPRLIQRDRVPDVVTQSRYPRLSLTHQVSPLYSP